MYWFVGRGLATMDIAWKTAVAWPHVTAHQGLQLY